MFARSRIGSLVRMVCVGVLLAGVLAALRPIAPAVAQPGWTAPPLPVAAFGTHPRLLITRDYIEQTLAPRVLAQASTWTAFESYVASAEPEEDAEWSPGTALRALALAWLVTGDVTYAARAKAVMVRLVNRIEAYPALTGTDGFDGALLEDVAALAVGYDWLYGALSQDDRAGVRLTLWRAVKVLRNPAADTDGIVWLDGQLMAFGNYDARWLWALTAAGLALWGENEDVPALLDELRGIFTQTVIPALELQTGGAWAEGPVYGFIAIWPKVQTALAWWTAAGENYFDDTAWWYDRLAYDMFLYHPVTMRAYNEEWGDLFPSYPSIIGDSERYHPIAALGRAQDLLLRAVYPNTEHGNWMGWFLRQPPGAMPAWMSAEEFLWRDPTWPGIPPFVNTWYAPYLGHVFMRSGWQDGSGALDSAATYVSFNAGDRLAYHQFYDQGNLTIFHNGDDLLVRSGVYSGDGTADHDANWYVRSIAGNTLLVCDLAESFDGIRPNNDREVWVNDCGQRSMRPQPRTAINVDYLLANWRAYDTGSITRFGESGAATYLRADITGAYNSTVYTTPENRAKVSAVIRELVYVRPNLVLVADRVVTTYPAYTPIAVYHFQTEPGTAGLWYGALVDDSAIYMQNLLPDSLVTLIPGFEVGGLRVDTAWGEPVRNDFERDPYGYFRLEITPGRPNLEHWFLTAFVVQAASAPAPAPGVLVMGDTLRGVALGAAQAMFDALPEDGQDVTAALFQVAPGVQTLLISGLAPGRTYRVIGEGGLDQRLSADAAGLLSVAGALPGALRLVAE